MSDISEYIPLPGIIGSDGKVPVYQPNARWCIWNRNEIYFGTVGTDRYVPKVKDLVLDQDFWTWYEVVSIDPVTYVPTLKEKKTVSNNGEFDSTDLLIGVGPGTQADTYRVFIDKTNFPYSLCVDARLSISGSMSKFCKIFKGADVSSEANVISKVYDTSHNYLGTSIPLELVKNVGNVATKIVPTAYTTDVLADGELVTAVFYADDGHVVSKRQLLVENTAFIRSTDSSVKYITDITLKSPFINNVDPLTISYPINVPTSSLYLSGVVHYSDGSTIELPVDGSKFTVFGFDNFVSTIIGQKLDIVLKYSLSPDEVCYAATQAADKFMTKSYKAVVAKVDGAYSVKLFGYPNWINGITGYRMEWFLYNLERNISKRVTPYVRVNENTGYFDPLLFATRQKLSVTLNLADVDPSFTYYRHVQAIDVTLAGPGGEDGTNWTVGFNPNQNPPYGVGNKFKFEVINQNLKHLRIDLGLNTQAEWLDKLYYQTMPLVNPYSEVEPLVPNAFAIVVGAERTEHNLSEWKALFSISENMWHGETVFIEFLRNTNNSKQLLSIAGVPAKQVTGLS